MTRLLVLAGLALLTACVPPAGTPHYQLGRPYQVNGVWFYPHEADALNATGLASVYRGGHPARTANGEAFDQSLVMAGHATLQLPAIARLTNLENGSSLLVRINDRGTGNPGRLIVVTHRTAALLGMRDAGATRVRLRLLPVESRAAVEGLPGAPPMIAAAAPRGAVTSDALPPPPGIRGSAGAIAAAAGAAIPDIQAAAAARLPETVSHGSADPGRLWVRLDTFEEYQYAAVQRARLGYLGARVESSFDGRVHRFWVRIGPLDTPNQADDALREVLSKDIPDARIVVE